jgi:dihydrofolate reductase
MGKVFFDVAISLDGYMAGENRGPQNPLGDNGTDLHQWMFTQDAFVRHLKLGEGEKDTIDNAILEKLFDRIGANILGKRMFEEGEANWPEDAPFNTPVFVLTNTPREPWERPGGTTFYFTSESIETVLEKAKAVAEDKDVRISGGANTIQQYLNAGLIDEFTIHIAPVMLTNGIRLFEGINKEKFSFEITEVINSPIITHLSYRVVINE